MKHNNNVENIFFYPAYERHWISWRVRIVAPIQKWTETNKKWQKEIKIGPVSCVTCQVSLLMDHVSYVTCHLSPEPVTCHLSLKLTATATDPPHTNSPIMYRRLVCKDPQNTKHFKTPKIIKQQTPDNTLRYANISDPLFDQKSRVPPGSGFSATARTHTHTTSGHYNLETEFL